MLNTIVTILGTIWCVIAGTSCTYLFYTFIRDDLRSEKKRKDDLKKNDQN